MTAGRVAGAFAAAIVSLTTALSAQQAAVPDIGNVLERAGKRVTEYFARAQSLVCLERVALQQLGMTWSPEGLARRVESELRLSWQPTPDDPTPKAKTVRQVLRANGRKPRKTDDDNCTAPEQNDEEEQPLSILLPQERQDYVFTPGGRDSIDGRDAIVIAFKEVRKPTVDVSMVKDNENCISFAIDGGSRGKIWIDAASHDVLRLDRSLNGLIDVPLPRKVTLRPGAALSWTVERLDSSIRFKRISFDNPPETLVLPVSSTTLKVMRGGGQPRLRTSTEYVSYRRFLTGGRILK
jgi:hypothetical protein